MAKAKIGFVLISPTRRALPSTRIAVLNMLPFLRTAGYEWEFFAEPDPPDEEPSVDGVAQRMMRAGVTLAFFQKVHGPSVLREAAILASSGVRTVYGACDFVDNAMVRICDATIAVTDYLKALYTADLQHKIHVVHDGIERPEVCKTNWAPARADGRLSAVLVNAITLDELPVIGTPPGFLDIQVVGRYPMAGKRFGHMRNAYWTLRGRGCPHVKRMAVKWLVTRPFRKVNWTPETVYEALRVADLAIIPIDPDPTPAPGLPVASWQLRSENRLTLKMALGLPVIASPVPSYLPVVEQGVNGYIARSRDEWMRCFEELRDAGRRESVGRAARASVLARFSLEKQARKLIAVLDAVTIMK